MNYDTEKDIEAEGQRAIPPGHTSAYDLRPKSPAFDQWYVENCFDLEICPMGCRDYVLQKSAWMARDAIIKRSSNAITALLAAAEETRCGCWEEAFNSCQCDFCEDANDAVDLGKKVLAELVGESPESHPRCAKAETSELLEALKAVVAIADRKTIEFDMAKAAIARAEGAS